MLSTDIKKEVAALWDVVSGAGLAPSPYVALEQIACLMFLKRLSALHVSPDADQFDCSVEAAALWRRLLELDEIGDYLQQEVFAWLRTLGQKKPFAPVLLGAMHDVYFQLDATKHQALKLLVRQIDGVCSDTINNGAYTSGQVLDELLAQASINSKIGRLTTAPHLAEFMVSLLEPMPQQSIIDPVAGTGTLLVSALNYMRANLFPKGDGVPGESGLLAGVDLDHIQTRLAWLRLYLHGVKSPVCVQGNSLYAGDAAIELLKTRYDFVIADIPFGGRVHPQDAWIPGRNAAQNRTPGTDRIELLFVWRALSLLNHGGSAALIIPQSLLSSEDDAHIDLRRELICNYQVQAIVLLPRKLFAPFTGIQAAVLVLRKPRAMRPSPPAHDVSPLTRNVWFYEVGDDGVSSDPRETGQPSADDDLLDAFSHFKNRQTDHDIWAYNKDSYFQHSPTHSSQENYWRTSGLKDRPVKGVKQWEVPVRSWARNPRGTGKDRTSLSHDENGGLREDYVERMEPQLYRAGELDRTLLTRNCIEACNWSLEPSKYKPSDMPVLADGKSALQLIDQLQAVEKEIVQNLEQLRALIGPAK